MIEKVGAHPERGHTSSYVLQFNLQLIAVEFSGFKVFFPLCFPNFMLGHKKAQYCEKSTHNLVHDLFRNSITRPIISKKVCTRNSPHFRIKSNLSKRFFSISDQTTSSIKKYLIAKL